MMVDDASFTFSVDGPTYPLSTHCTPRHTIHIEEFAMSTEPTWELRLKPSLGILSIDDIYNKTSSFTIPGD